MISRASGLLAVLGATVARIAGIRVVDESGSEIGGYVGAGGRELPYRPRRIRDQPFPRLPRQILAADHYRRPHPLLLAVREPGPDTGREVPVAGEGEHEVGVTQPDHLLNRFLRQVGAARGHFLPGRRMYEQTSQQRDRQRRIPGQALEHLVDVTGSGHERSQWLSNYQLGGTSEPKPLPVGRFSK
ncbi:hypothetical protein ABZY09_25025 [Streptomyces sp. NPDC002928]|uniref:hypothetical protein n=1 Tax=Streptomyces sp. NPDC002928 TaxID=3154440 RepID=UPI0033A3A5BF